MGTSSGRTSAPARTRSTASSKDGTRRGAFGRPSHPSYETGAMTATATDTTPTIELRGISKSFGPVQALADVDFFAYPGEVMALVGDNGAGKSTLIKTIAGIHSADSGEFWFEGN